MPSCKGVPLVQTASLRPIAAFAGLHYAFPVFIACSGSTTVFNPSTGVSICGHPKKEIVSRSGSKLITSTYRRLSHRFAREASSLHLPPG
jgi:hypothetical protein